MSIHSLFQRAGVVQYQRRSHTAQARAHLAVWVFVTGRKMLLPFVIPISGDCYHNNNINNDNNDYNNFVFGKNVGLPRQTSWRNERNKKKKKVEYGRTCRMYFMRSIFGLLVVLQKWENYLHLISYFMLCLCYDTMKRNLVWTQHLLDVFEDRRGTATVSIQHYIQMGYKTSLRKGIGRTKWLAEDIFSIKMVEQNAEMEWFRWMDGIVRFGGGSGKTMGAKAKNKTTWLSE